MPTLDECFEIPGPYVCPTCHAVAPDFCASWCFDPDGDNARDFHDDDYHYFDEDEDEQMTTQLQPCPFCGWSHHEDCADHDPKGKFCWVYCGKCEAYGPSARTQEEAHRLWNVRNSEPDLGCEETER